MRGDVDVDVSQIVWMGWDGVGVAWHGIGKEDWMDCVIRM